MCWDDNDNSQASYLHGLPRNHTRSEGQLGFIHSFSEIDIDEVDTNCFVLHPDLPLFRLSDLHILPLQRLFSHQKRRKGTKLSICIKINKMPMIFSEIFDKKLEIDTSGPPSSWTRMAFTIFEAAAAAETRSDRVLLAEGARI